MSARSKRPPRSRREERPAKLQPESGRVSSAKSGEARVKPSKAELRSERAAARLDAIERNASTIPPAAMHDVFEVRVPPPGRSIGSSLPPPLPPRAERRKRERSGFAKPAPHPPRPTKPPTATPLPLADARTNEDTPEGVELSASEFEFASDPLGVPPLAAPRTDAPVELHVELPPEQFDEPRPPRVPYRTIALTSAALMVVLIVFGLFQPKQEWSKHASTKATQAPLAAALAEPAPVVPQPAPQPAAPEPPAAESAPVPDAGEEAGSAPAPSASAAKDAVPDDPPSLAQAMASAAERQRVTPPPSVSMPAFDSVAASSAITAAFARAGSCLEAGDPRNAATIHLTYAPSGRVTSAVLSGPYAGSAIGGCIASKLRTARIPAFSGDYVTVKRTSVLQ